VPAETLPVVVPGITIKTATVPVFDIVIAFVWLTPNCTEPIKFEPFTVTNVPTGPADGLNDVIIGACPKAIPTFRSENSINRARSFVIMVY
jgi:hypothetical protein